MSEIVLHEPPLGIEAAARRLADANKRDEYYSVEIGLKEYDKLYMRLRKEENSAPITLVYFRGAWAECVEVD